jgi:tRNA (guanosine-2'-O-)-methyltransferase
MTTAEVARLPWVPETLARGNPLRRRSCVRWVGGDPIDWLARQRDFGSVIVGVEQIDEAIRLADLPAARARTVAVLGDEQGGIPPGRWTCSIAPLETPMVGTGTSLNVAVAGSLVLTAWLGSFDRAN